MSTEANKAAIRRNLEEVWNKGILSVADETLAVDLIRHDPGTPQLTGGRESFKQFVAATRVAFPDIHFTVDDQVAEGDKVATRWTIRATHKGEFMGIPATGKRVTVQGIEIARFAGGKLVEGWHNWDSLGLLQQLGAIPAKGYGNTTPFSQTFRREHARELFFSSEVLVTTDRGYPMWDLPYLYVLNEDKPAKPDVRPM